MFNKYPYTDFHELNLDWIIYQIKKIHAEWTEYQVLNHITFRGIWDISEQYPAWSIVTDNNVGFVSIKPVPAGIEITNADYWIKICDYSQVIEDFNDRIANLESVITLGNSNIYVSFVNGDDSNVGTIDSPIQTLTHAGQLIKNLTQGNVNIYIDNTGAYSDDLIIVNATAYTITIQGCDSAFAPLTSGYVIAKGLDLECCSRVYANRMSFNSGTNYSAFTRNSFVIMNDCEFNATYPNSCIGSTESSTLILNACNLASGNVGVSSNYASTVFMHACSIDTNIGCWPKYGSQASYDNDCVFNVSTQKIFNETGSLALSPLGNTTAVLGIGTLQYDTGSITIPFLDQIGCANKLILILSSGSTKSIGFGAYDVNTKIYEGRCVNDLFAAYDLGDMMIGSDHLKVNATSDGTSISLNVQNLSGALTGINYILMIA